MVKVAADKPCIARRSPPKTPPAKTRFAVSRPRVVAGVTFCIAGLAALVFHGSLHYPLPPAAGGELTCASPVNPPSRATFRAGTFNIHSGRDAAGRYDLRRTAACLENLDFVGLNEVRGEWPWEESGQAESLGRLLGRAWLFAPTTRRWHHDDFGNALLSNLPVKEWRREPLPCSRNKGYRNFVTVEASIQSRTLHILVTHLDRVHDRDFQFELVLDRFLSSPEPAMLMGDFNMSADEPLLAAALQVPGVHDVVGEGLRAQDPHAALPRRIDWILARGLRGISAGVEDLGASDHPLVWAEVELAPSPAEH